MAIQMLYQHELGQRPLAEIFEAFDVDDYVLETAPGGSGPEASGSEASDPEAGDPEASSQKDNGSPSSEVIEGAFAYARQLVEGTAGNLEAIDQLIRRHAENWRLERMPVIDRNILRIAVYEMLYESSVPKVVIVDEAIELAKKFGSENSGRFVNGLLDGVLKSGGGAAELAAVPGVEEPA